MIGTAASTAQATTAMKVGSAHVNPFPGLRPFREDEDHLFFGREAHVDQMVDVLAATGFLAVVGSSGSGKSSLVSCGLVPALHRGLLAARPGGWRVAVLRPGNRPIRSLAQALAQVLPVSSSTGFSPVALVEATLRASKRGLLEAWREAGAAATPQPNMLVVVDQFEELFRYRGLGDVTAAAVKADASAAEAVAFVNLLLEVNARTQLPLAVVITMRSDFLGECAQFQGLPEAINRGQFLVPRMSRDERRAAIRGPLAMCAAEVDPVLLNRLVNDVGDNPDQLSILQHALNRTWAHWQRSGAGGPLNGRDYDAVGTMEQALDRHADEALAQLTAPDQAALCEQVFRAITDRGTDARGIRRPTRLDTLIAITGADAAALEAVMAPFRDPQRAFLMPPHGVALESTTPVDISHESLMRVWTRLKGWAEAEALSARVYRRLCESAELYADKRTTLLGPPELQVALAWRGHVRPNAAWAERYRPGFDSAMRFLDDSLADFERRQAEAEARRSAEAAAEQLALRRRVNQRWQLWVTPLGLVALVAVVLLFFAGQRQMDKAVEKAADASAAEQAAKRARDEAATAQAEARRALADLQAETAAVQAIERAAPQAAAQLRKAAEQVQTRPLVYLQFTDERQRADLQALRLRLQDSGYDAPAIEKVRAVPQRNELRYFSGEDANLAQKLAALCSERGIGTVVARLVPSYAGSTRRQQFELWLAPPAADDAVAKLALALNAVEKDQRLRALQELKDQHAGSADAMAAVLATLGPDTIGQLSAEGRFNALWFLSRTAPSAWNRGLVQTAREALARLREREKAGVALGGQSRAEMQRIEALLAALPEARS